MIAAQDVLREQLNDPDLRAGWEACAIGRALGLWLLRYRLDHQLEFDQLAAQLGLDFDSLSNLEGGDEDPPAATLLWLSQALGTPIELRVERGVPGEVSAVLIVDATTAQAA